MVDGTALLPNVRNISCNPLLVYVGYEKESDLYYVLNTNNWRQMCINESDARLIQEYKNNQTLGDMSEYAYQGECSMENSIFARYQYAIADAKLAATSCIVL